MKPSVLHVVSTSQRRGAEVFACDLSMALGQMGHESEVVALVPASNESAIDVETLGPGRRHPRTLGELRRRGRGVDIVVAHGGATLEACAISLAMSGTPFVYRVISDPRYWIDSMSKRFRLRRLHRLAHHHVALSGVIVPYLEGVIGLDAQRISVIPNAVAFERFTNANAEARQAARDQFHVSGGNPVVAFVGALAPEKNLSAVLKWVEKNETLNLLVAGEGPDVDLLHEAQRTSWGTRVRYIGSTGDVWPVYAAADALILPSLTEMMPAVVIEAAMVGTPVIARPVGALIEMSDSGLPVLFVESDEHAVLDDALIQALTQGRPTSLDVSAAVAPYRLETVAAAWSSLITSQAGGP